MRTIIEIEITRCEEGRVVRKALGVDLNDHPEDQHLYFIKELFRSALRELYGDECRIDITRRGKVPDGLPH